MTLGFDCGLDKYGCVWKIVPSSKPEYVFIASSSSLSWSYPPAQRHDQFTMWCATSGQNRMWFLSCSMIGMCETMAGWFFISCFLPPPSLTKICTLPRVYVTGSM